MAVSWNRGWNSSYFQGSWKPWATQSCCLCSALAEKVFFYGSPPYSQESESHSVRYDSLWPHGLYRPWNSSGLNTGMDSHSLLQGIFPTQKFNQGLPHCRWIFYQLSHQGSPNMFEWVAYSFSSRSSLPGIKPESPALQADPLPAELPGKQAILTQFCFIDWAKLISITLRISGLLS